MKPVYSLLFLCSLFYHAVPAQDTLHLQHADAILYTGVSDNEPLVVGLGGSEGGNAWAGNHWKPVRDSFIRKGYAFLAVGYFKTPHSPAQLEKIAIEDIYNAILEARKHAKVDGSRTAIVGGSRGADLALLTASYYPDISCVVGLASSHVVFPGNTDHLTTSSWTYQMKELPFVPVNEEAVPFLIKGNLRGAFETMLQDTAAERKALIHVENIRGNILLLSGTEDEICPSSPMSEKMIQRLKAYRFPFHYEHIAYPGGHAEPMKHFDVVFRYLDKYFLHNR